MSNYVQYSLIKKERVKINNIFRKMFTKVLKAVKQNKNLKNTL